jgi:hypothetical protein
MKKNRGDEPIVVIIHVYMEMSQETHCVAIFTPNKQKCHFFSFFFYKIQEQEDGICLAVGGGVVPVKVG